MNGKKSICAALLILEICVGMSAEEKTWKFPPNQEMWKKDSYTEWLDGGFKLVNRNYGAIESKEKLPFKSDASVKLEIKNLKNCWLTLQVLCFDNSGKFIEAVTISDKTKELGQEQINLSNFKVPSQTTNIRFKIWIASGNSEGECLLGELTYSYKE